MTHTSNSQKLISRTPLIGGTHEITAIIQSLHSGKCVRFVGPRYHHKSPIMRAACKKMDKVNGYISLYISLDDASSFSSQNFFQSIRHLLVTKSLRYASRRLPQMNQSSEAEMTRFLTLLPEVLGANVSLFIDDLEAASPAMLKSLLTALRAAYIMTTDKALRLVVAVCASNSLARVALGRASPFENISQLILVEDLNSSDTQKLSRILLHKHCPFPESEALQYIYKISNGDRFLVSEICHTCCHLASARNQQRLTKEFAAEVVDYLIENVQRELALAEGLQHIERDPDLLHAISMLMGAKRLHISKMPFDVLEKPDPLTMSGFVSLKDDYYFVKSDFHQRLLCHHFSNERFGRMFAAAGCWDDAIDYFGIRTPHHDSGEDQERVMLATVNAMYSAKNKREAFEFLVHGIEQAYPNLKFKVYDFVPNQRVLQGFYPPAIKKSARHLANNCQELRVLDTLHDYDFQSIDRYKLNLLLPLRVSDDEPQGLIVVNNLVTRQNRHDKQETITGLVNQLRHAARALSNRQDYEALHRKSERRADDLSQLLKLTQALMDRQTTDQKEALRQTLRSALGALADKAQAGSIYLYDQKTDRVKLIYAIKHGKDIHDILQFKPGDGLAGQIYKTGSSRIVRNVSADKYYKIVSRDGVDRVKSVVGVPLMGRYGPLGVLCLDSLEHINGSAA